MVNQDFLQSYPGQSPMFRQWSSFKEYSIRLAILENVNLKKTSLGLPAAITGYVYKLGVATIYSTQCSLGDLAGGCGVRVCIDGSFNIRVAASQRSCGIYAEVGY